MDDEYFRAAVITSELVFEHPLATPAREPFLRSLDNPGMQGFTTTLAKSVTRVVVDTDGCREEQYFLGFDKRRIDRVSQRIVRGLFFHECRYTVPKDYSVIGFLFRKGSFDQFLDNIKRLIELPPIKVAQDGVFYYRFWAAESTTLLLACFYNKLFFVGHTHLAATRQFPASQ